jgi:hypothetical protein
MTQISKVCLFYRSGYIHGRRAWILLKTAKEAGGVQAYFQKLDSTKKKKKKNYKYTTKAYGQVSRYEKILC